jgi:FdhD protein
MTLDPDSDAPRDAPAIGRWIVKVRHSGMSECRDHVAVEEPLEIRLAGQPLSVTMRTPGEDAWLVAGFLFSEGLIGNGDDVDVIAHYRGPPDDPDRRNIVNVLLKGDVRVAKERLRRNFISASSCGLCGTAMIEAIRIAHPPVESNVTVPIEVFRQLVTAMSQAQATFEKTGGLHAAGLFTADGQVVALSEDIGRHNAVDKVIGRMVLAGAMPLDRHILMVSGRASFEIIQKAVVARIPIIAAVSAPSSMAVQTAEAANVTLVGFVRDTGFNVYTGAHRVVGGATREFAR